MSSLGLEINILPLPKSWSLGVSKKWSLQYLWFNGKGFVCFYKSSWAAKEGNKDGQSLLF